jgi:hypothetical protein
MSLTVTDVVSQYGAYYLNQGQNEKRLLQLLTQGRQLPGHCTPMPTDETIFRLANPTFRSLVQPFQKTFTQKGGAEFKPNEIRLFHMKMDDEFHPDDLTATWLGFLASMDVAEREKWPFVKWLMENYYKNQIDQDVELNEYYKGVYSTPVTGTAGEDGTGMDGLKLQLQRGVDAGTINSVNIGTLSTATIFDQVEEFTDGISEVYSGIAMDVYMSQYWYKKYMQDKRAQGFFTKFNAGEIDGSIDFTPLNVKPLAAMAGTSDIFCTPKANLLHLYSLSANKKKFVVEASKRNVAVMADWWEGLGFGINQAVWTNIQATASGSASV